MLPLASLAVLLATTPVSTAPEAVREAPRFEVEEGASLPLREQSADVAVAGIVAHVKLRQRWVNEGAGPVDARYVFPGSTRAALFALRIEHRGRVIEAEIAPRDEARKVYETARDDGRMAGLLEQHRPNMLEMSVANIAPRDSLVVEMEWIEHLVPVDGRYEWVLPGAVGPRYVRAGDPALPAAHAAGAPLERWRVDVAITAGMPLHMVSSPSHRVKPRYDGANLVAELRFDDPTDAGRDLVVEWWLAGGAIETGLLVSPDPDGTGGHFLLLVEPPARVQPADVPPREFIFVLDVSGSMGGYPLATAKQLMRDLLETLRPEDRFNLVLFSGASSVYAPESLAATPESIAGVQAFVDGAHAGGGTELVPALATAMALPRSPNVARVIAVITDGYVSAEAEAFRSVREKLGDASLFAFGIGTSVNRFLIEGLAHAGRAEPFVVESDTVAAGKAAEFREYVSSPVLTGVRARFDGIEALDLEPSALPDLFARRPIAVLGRYRGKPLGSIRLAGRTAAGVFTREMRATQVHEGPALKLLWARERIARLELEEGFSGQHDADIEALGLAHSLLTRRTSFVAVDRHSRATRPVTPDAPQAPASDPFFAPAFATPQPPPSPSGPAASSSAPVLAEPALAEAFAIPAPATEAPPTFEARIDSPTIRIADAHERAERSKARASLKSLLPIHTLLLPLTFARASEMAALLRPFLSRQGQIFVDERTSTLLLQDHREELERLRELARFMDVPTPLRGPAVVVTRLEAAPGSGIDASTARGVLDASLIDVRVCFSGALAEHPELAGTLVVELEVDATGRVTLIAVTEGTLPGEGVEVERCLLDALGLLPFRGTGGPSRLTFELVFGGQGRQ